MIFIKSKYYPVKGFNAITHWPFVFYKKDSMVMRNHERIHGRQQIELGILGLLLAASIVLVFKVSYWLLILGAALFYLIYFIEWIFKGYKGISFEREAYKNQMDENYWKLFGWIRYL